MAQTKPRETRTEAGKEAITEPGFEVSSGNIFDDLGLPQADVLLQKSTLLIAIGRAMKLKRLSQSDLAKLTGVAQGSLSKLVNGDTRGFSVERLTQILNALGMDVDVIVRAHEREGEAGRTKVLLVG